jgi:hypothetical protein
VSRGSATWIIERPEVERGRPGTVEVVADKRRAVVRVPGVAVFAVEEGARVLYEPAIGSHPGEIDAWLHATVTALLLAQQGRFALHATAVRIDGTDVAIAGGRGTGKTTTALALSRRGHGLLCDDVLPLEPGSGHTQHVPSLRPVRVAPDTASALGLEVSGRRARAGKLALPCALAAPSRLDAIVVMRPSDGASVERHGVSRAAALPLIFRQAYRRGLLAPWRAEIFRWAAGVASTVPVWILPRPADGWTPFEVARAIEAVVTSRLDARGA